jgi:hypothetical protein
MRVVVGTETARDSRQSELRRHLQMLSRFIDSAKAGSTLTMILRCAGADPAKALVGMQGALLHAGVRAKVILAKIEPDDELRQLFAALTALGPERDSSELIRWARNPRLLDAHEQVTYGEAMCWSGDPMRRDADKRNALTLFDEQAAEAVRFGRLAFEALWAASSLVPERRLTGPLAPRPSGAFEHAEAPVAALRPSLQGWPLVRH